MKNSHHELNAKPAFGVVGLTDTHDSTAKINFGMAKKKDKIVIFGSNYGDEVIESATEFKNVMVLDSRIPCLNHAKLKTDLKGLKNVDFFNQHFMDFQSSEVFDCILLASCLNDYQDEFSQLKGLLKAATLLAPGGLLMMVVPVKEQGFYISLALRLGFSQCSELGEYNNVNTKNICLTFNLDAFSTSKEINSTLKVAGFGSMHFHFRSLKPLVKLFKNHLVTLSKEEVISWRPDVIVVADGWSVEYWRDYCDANNVLLIGMRHGSVTRYGFAESQYNYADYMCGSPWDIEDTLLSKVQPRKGFLITGNSWVDEVFKIEKSILNKNNPTILFAPTYNPEISSAVYFGERVVSLIRSVYPSSKIIIKPHPAIVEHEHGFVVDKNIFRELMSIWRQQSIDDPLVELIDNPEASIAESFAQADILLADASSLIYEFMVLDRPIILYSTEKKVEHWEYNPDAPGNAWRDIGLEFNEDQQCVEYLRNAFSLHDKYCRVAQYARTQFLHGIYQDGESTNRVANAIINQSKLEILVYGDSTTWEERVAIAEKLCQTFAFSRISILNDVAFNIENFSTYCDWRKWSLSLNPSCSRHQDVLLVNADHGLIPSSAHQVTKGRRDLARNELHSLVIRSKGSCALALISSANLTSFIACSLHEEDEREKDWPQEELNITLGKGIVRNPGKSLFFVSDVAELEVNSAITGVKPKKNHIQLHISLLEKSKYNKFPLKTKIFVNGELLKEVTFDGVNDQILTIPFIVGLDNRSVIKLVSDARAEGMLGVIDNISFIMRTSYIDIDSVIKIDNGISAWLNKRKLNAAQEEFVKKYRESMSIVTTNVLCLVINNGHERKLQNTLNNLNDINGSGVNINLSPVVINSIIEPINGSVYEHCASGLSELTLNLNQEISSSTCDWFILLKAGETFTQSGSIVASLQLPLAKNCAAIYTDSLFESDDGISSVVLHPDFNLDLILSLPSVMTENWIFNRETFIQLGGFSSDYPRATEFEYITRIIEERGIGVIGHLNEPAILREPFKLSYVEDQKLVIEKHLRNRGYVNAEVTSEIIGVWRLKYNVDYEPLVSIIIPTKDQLPLLVACVTTILEKSSYHNYEILIVDNNSELNETKTWLDGIAQVDPERIRVISYPYPFNYSAMNNMAAREAKGEYLVLLNNDTAIIQNEWLNNMLNHALRPEVGIVGAKLYYPNSCIQHAGVVLGLRGPADHPFIGKNNDDRGYLYRLVADQNYTAVTAACLMVRKEVYDAVGGLDEENFKVSYNDIDFCLKVREAGYMTVWTPYAKVMHEGSVSQSKIDLTKQHEKIIRFQNEQDAMYKKWSPLIANDPAYNSSLTKNGEGFELIENSKLTWQPVFWKPAPNVLAHMADENGCGNYRIIKPFEAMQHSGLIQGTLSNLLLSYPQLMQLETDSIVFQREISPEFHEWIRRASKFLSVFKVYELDDYLPNVPIKNMHRAHMPKDILKSLRKSLSLVDRFVVSTAALANRFDGLHNDIQISENRLPVKEWGNLISLRGQGRKPRVGWAGGSSHTGDLEMIYDVIRALSDRVEWVFMGMCPPKLRPYLYEYHHGVDFASYPEKLASLNLDLALAPVEDNEFNRCKSNLRLLEYGACGYPVICSDVECYRNDLPVTRVKNRYKDWIEAIEMHLADPSTSLKTGDALRKVVLEHWMLKGEPLKRWSELWLP